MLLICFRCRCSGEFSPGAATFRITTVVISFSLYQAIDAKVPLAAMAKAICLPHRMAGTPFLFSAIE